VVLGLFTVLQLVVEGSGHWVYGSAGRLVGRTVLVLAEFGLVFAARLALGRALGPVSLHLKVLLIVGTAALLGAALLGAPLLLMSFQF
jgi:hypothetical protein